MFQGATPEPSPKNGISFFFFVSVNIEISSFWTSSASRFSVLFGWKFLYLIAAVSSELDSGAVGRSVICLRVLFRWAGFFSPLCTALHNWIYFVPFGHPPSHGLQCDFFGVCCVWWLLFRPGSTGNGWAGCHLPQGPFPVGRVLHSSLCLSS